MGWLGGSKTTGVGVDLEGAAMRAVQVSKSGGTVTVTAAAEAPRPDPEAPIGEEDIALLLDVMDRLDFDRRGLVVATPAESVFSEVLELPPRDSGAPVEKLAKMEVSRIRHREADSFELACWDLPAPVRAGEATHVLGMGCEHAAANELLDLFESQGATVHALDVRACALARALGSYTTTGVTGVVEFGWDRTRLIAMLGDIVLYERSVEDSGVRTVREEVMNVLGVDGEVADFLLTADREAADPMLVDECASVLESVWAGAVEEINASLTYAEHRYANADLRRLVLIGAGAGMPRATTLLADALSFEPGVVALGDLAACDLIDDRLAASPAMTAALGLAMWEA